MSWSMSCVMACPDDLIHHGYFVKNGQSDLEIGGLEMSIKIALLYGHVASNIGDLAINCGTINLVRRICSDAVIDVVFIDAKDSDYIEAARTSFDNHHGIRFYEFETHGEKGMRYILSPNQFLIDTGLLEADIFILSAGEHFFSYQHGGNDKSLFWRALPAYIAKYTNKKCIFLPSTFGPFESDRSIDLILSLLNLSDAFATRDACSARLLKSRYSVDNPLLLDPAFFLESPKNLKQIKQKHCATGFVMRSEGWGIRLSGESREKHAALLKSSGYENNKAFAFSCLFVKSYLSSTSDALRIFVQTTADQALADELGKRFADHLESGRLSIERPYSVSDYLFRLNEVDRVVSNRFHALVLGLVVNKPVYGLYFDVHGHKIPGLFDLLAINSNCINLSQIEPEMAVRILLNEIAAEEGGLNGLWGRIDVFRDNTVKWLANEIQQLTKVVDSQILLAAASCLGSYASDQFRMAIAVNLKTQLTAVKKAAQTKEVDLMNKIKQMEKKILEYKSASHNALEELNAVNAEMTTKESAWAEKQQRLVDELSKMSSAYESCCLQLEALRAEAQVNLDHWSAQKSQYDNRTVELTDAYRGALEELRAVNDELSNMSTAHESCCAQLNAVNVEAQASRGEWTNLKAQYEYQIVELTDANQNILDDLNSAKTKSQGITKELNRQLKQNEQKLLKSEQLLSKTMRQLSVANANAAVKEKTLMKSVRAISEIVDKVNLEQNELLGKMAILIAESNRLSAINQAQFNSLTLELPNTLSNKLGDALIQGFKSPLAIILLPFRLYRIWSDAHSRKCYKKLGGEKFDQVIADYFRGGLAAVEQLLDDSSLSKIAIANAYTALSRHLKNKNSADAIEAARRAYIVDPRLFRRKWLVFRLAEAGHILESDALLGTLPDEIELSQSEMTRSSEIRDMAASRRNSAVRIGVVAKDLMKIPNLLKLIVNARNEIAKPAAKPNLNVVIKNTSEATMQIKPTNVDDYYINKCKLEGFAVLTEEVYAKFKNTGSIGAQECIRIAKMLCKAGIPEAEFSLVSAAKAIHSSSATIKAFFWAAQREKRFLEACNAIFELEQLFGLKISADETEIIRKMKATPSYQLMALRLVENKKPSILDYIPKRICYVLHNSLPYSSGGYATRARGVAGGLKNAGYDVVIATRPGFPLDIKSDLRSEDINLEEVIDGIKHLRILDPLRRGKSMFNYVQEAAKAIENKLLEIKPEIVMAASNHITALPALIAARRLGLRFIYEVRGLWEITRMSREEEFKNTAAFAVQSILESAVCIEADQVFTLTKAMREELIARGVNASKISLIPNSCDPEKFLPRSRDNSLAEKLDIPLTVPVIGYVGTFVDYEGLEDLAAACALLKDKKIEFRLLLVGNENASGQDRGPITEHISEIARLNDFSNWLIMPGRVPHEEVDKYYSLIDIAPFPRKPLPVCEMVSPMKPLEAFAMEKTVVVSSVQALQDMVVDNETGLVFEKGNVQSLANVLERLVVDPDLRASLGRNGREWVMQERTWNASILAIVSRINTPLADSTVLKAQPDLA